MQIFPDLVLTSTERGHRLMGTVEVETAESVNHLEAMAQWAHLGRARAPFHLYVPAGSVDIARRLAAENQVNVAEIWSYPHDRRPDPVHDGAPRADPRTPPCRRDKPRAVAAVRARVKPAARKGTARPAQAKASARKAPAARAQKRK